MTIGGNGELGLGKGWQLAVGSNNNMDVEYSFSSVSLPSCLLYVAGE
jgi:hypothetical protein